MSYTLRKHDYYQRGLRADGKPWKGWTRHRPELAGLTGRDYHVAYLRLKRNGLLKQNDPLLRQQNERECNP